MPQVTSVTPQKRNPHRFDIYLDGRFAFGADEDLVINHRLIVGKTVPSEMMEQLIWEAGVGKLMEKVLALFDRRMRTEKEIRDYLRGLSFKRRIKDQEEISSQAVELVIHKLKQKRLLDDVEFAKAWVEARGTKKGIKVLRAELYKRGIDKEVIEQATGVESLESNQDDAAEKLLIKRLPRWQSLPALDQKRKAIEFLLRRGFEYVVVKKVVAKILGNKYNNS